MVCFIIPMKTMHFISRKKMSYQRCGYLTIFKTDFTEKIKFSLNNMQLWPKDG